MTLADSYVLITGFVELAAVCFVFVAVSRLL